MSKFLLTGSSSPLGEHLAKSLLDQGHMVLAVVREINNAPKFLRDSKSFRLIEADLSSEKNVLELIEEIKENHRDIYGFIHLAAMHPTNDLNFTSLTNVFCTNVFSAWMIADACIDLMKTAKSGRVLFIGSVGQKFGGKEGAFGYAATKFTLEYFPRSFRECGKYEVLVNTLRLGVLNSPKSAVRKNSKESLAKREALIPVRRAATTQEAVDLMLFLVSKNNGYIHNEVIAATGGE